MFWLINSMFHFLFLPHAYAFYEPGALILTPTAGTNVYDKTATTKSSPTFGARADYCLVANDVVGISLEGLVNFTQLKSKTGNNANAYLLRIGPLFSFPQVGGITPFLTASIGGMYSSGAVNSMPDKNSFMTFGLGASYLFGKRMAVRADISRMLVLDINGSNGFEMTAGLSYAFGGKEKKTTALVESMPYRTTVAGSGADKEIEAAPVKQVQPETVQSATAEQKPMPKVAAPVVTATAPVAAQPETSSTVPDKPVSPETAQLASAVEQKPTSFLPLATKTAVSSIPTTAAAPAQPVAQGGIVPSLEEKLVAADNEPSLSRLRNVKTVVTIEFATGKSTLDPKYHGQMKKIAILVKSDPDLQISIAAHTDDVGNAHANYLLSQKRAQSAKNYFLKSLGIDPWRISAKGYGSYEPVTDNATTEGKRKNRRIVIIVLITQSQR